MQFCWGGGRACSVCVGSAREYRIHRVVKFGILRKSALTELLLFCANGPDNFLERNKERGKGGVSFPHSFPSMVDELGN